ncbi:hypothetical protein CHS0354_021746 [Potamilus streckersoni]|uniref:Polynucleotide 5'-hydroxyl-kinase NOL9 n=1 Tax=Potamilus streckersoni TaxID=2493646 RepID=A0AAE0WGZ9_9BIVA|nr:hypothetical protein CHS0354_021746 [Potamilus streckersoni]
MKQNNTKKSAFAVARERKIATELRHDTSGARNNDGDFKVPKIHATQVEKKKKRKHLVESVSKARPGEVEGYPIGQEKVRKKKKDFNWDAVREEVENSLQCKAHKKRKKNRDFKSSDNESFNLKEGDNKDFESNTSSQTMAENSVHLDTTEEERVALSGVSSSVIEDLFYGSRSSVATIEKSGSKKNTDRKSDKRRPFYAKDKSNRKRPRSRSEKMEQRLGTTRDGCRDSDKTKNLNKDSDNSTHSHKDFGKNRDLHKDSVKMRDTNSNSDFNRNTWRESVRKDTNMDSGKTTLRDISRSRSEERSNEHSEKAKHISPETPEKLMNDPRDVQIDYDSEKRKRLRKRDKRERDHAVSSSNKGQHRKSSIQEKDSKNSRSFDCDDIDGEQDDQYESQCQKSDEYLSREKGDRLEVDKAFKKERSMAFKSSDGAVLVLCHPQELCMKGRITVQVICGAVSVLGYTLTESQKFRNIFSPESNSLLTMTTMSATDDIDEVLKRTKDLVLRPEKIEQCLKCYKGHVVVLQLRNLEFYVYDHLTTFEPFENLFGKYEEKCEGMNVVLSPLGVNFREVSQFKRESRFPVLEMTKDYQNVMDLLTDLLSQRDSSQPVIVTCGGKNSGKSTLNRLLINSALQQVDRLCYLECDLGQTEFTPPGCVSLHVLTKPVFGPPFSHQKQAVSCCFHGDLSPSSDPDWYLRCIWQVLQCYQQMADCVPLIVNTMGWVKGLGLQLLLDILRMLQPTLVIQLDRQNQTQNCSALTPQLVMAEQSWSQNFGSSTAWETNSLNYQLIGLESVVVSAIQHPIKLRPVDHRNLTLLSYLCQSVEPGVTLYSMVPTVLPWHSIAIHVGHICVPNSQVMFAINASVVALCSADLSKAYRLDEESPMFFKKTPVHQCLGFGFIRCIDPERKLLYLVTPLSFKKLEKVNTLIKGAVTLPDSILFNQKSGLVQAYVDDSLTTLGASSLKQRRHLPRRYAMETQ